MGDRQEIDVVPRGPVCGTVRVPSSKSLTNRALALAALVPGRSAIEDPLVADDTTRMILGLRDLGVRIEAFGPEGEALNVTAGRFDPDWSGRFGSGPAVPDSDRPLGPGAGAPVVTVEGSGGRLTAPHSPLDLGGAGTAMRFLTALSSLASGTVVLDGDARMRERPMGPLLDALRALGVDARSLPGNGSPPVQVRGGTLEGGTVRIAGDVSSQFISALLMIAPLARGPSVLEVLPPVTSRPYIDLTLGLMERFGIDLSGRGSRPHAGEAPGTADRSRKGSEPDADEALDATGRSGMARFEFSGRAAYSPVVYRVPPDATSASYFFAAAAATEGQVTVLGLRSDDTQGDVALLGYLQEMGCFVKEDETGVSVTGPAAKRLLPFDLDLGATPDIVPTLAVLALFADGTSEIRNVANLRFKESDRLQALASELRRLGAEVEERQDGLRITPDSLRGCRIETYNDHRIAMAFAVAGLVLPGVTIADPGCVAKSFPGFWTALAGLTMSRP